MSIAQAQTSRDVGGAEFEQAVIEESRRRLVVVDFWAAWCGPCRTLGPVLERAVASYNGAVLLAKVDVDSNQPLAARYGVQGIPAVKAFRDGRVVAEFTGAQPEPQVRRWLQGLVPSAAVGLAQEAAQLAAAGESEAALARYREALAQEATPEVVRGLAGLLLPRDPEEADAVLRTVPGGAPGFVLAQQLRDLVPLYAAVAGAFPTTSPADGASLDERFRWAAALATNESWQPALDALLAIVARDRGYRDDAARKALLGLFGLLGDANPLVPAYRKRLASTLF